jgi:predicted transcriptional regulator
MADEKHYSPDEIAELWGVSTETIRSIFREESGVLKIGKTGTKYKRGYVTLRIPREVAERVHRRLSA